MGYSQRLKEKILSAPNSPGVYLMRDAAGLVLYVGKANSLKRRLFSYLSAGLNNKTASLMAKVVDIEFRLCSNEDMALLLEASLIRELKPRYNVSLRDDKSFPLVKISREDFPAVYITRSKDDSGAQYIGPYTNVKLLKNALKIIRRSFPYRSCKRMPKQYCLYHRINLCPAPCIGRISRKEYRRVIDNIILILEGKTDLLIRGLAKLMRDKSKALDFEAAASARDQIAVLSENAFGPSEVNRRREAEDLKNRLGLKTLPEKIEGFDISNISGNQAVGSMVSFHNGIPDKNNYRRFRIKSVQGIDDYKMLAEVLRRRFTRPYRIGRYAPLRSSRLIKERGDLPDLALIDGGKGHLRAAARQLKELHLKLPLAGIAKKEEHVYAAGRGGPLNFPKDAPALNLIRRVRDEAHRFALAYHHLLRKKELAKCMLSKK